MIWFTSDLHLGHANVLSFTKRQYADIDAMNQGLIDAINDCVEYEDELHILGDYSYKTSRNAARLLRHQIKCRNVHLIRGNHDRDWTQPEVADTFIVDPLIHTIKLADGRKVVLSHYPILDWPAMSHGSIHLHGHIHSDGQYNVRCREAGLLRYDVGVDANGCVPVSLEHILTWFEGVDYVWRPFAQATGEELETGLV